MAELVEKILPTIREYLEFLNRPIYGRPLLAWLKLAFIYSFVIWLGITGWKSYLFYQTYQNLERKKEAKISELQRIKNSISRYKQKIEDINLAYKEISKVFSPEKIQKLKRKLNALVKNLKSKKSVKDIYPYNPYRFVTYNYPINLSQFFGKLEAVSLEGISFPSKSVGDYKSALTGIYSAFRRLTEREIRGSVRVTFAGDKLALFFVRGGGGLSVKGIGLKGLIGNAEKVPYFPTTTYFYRASEKLPNLTQIFFGWDLDIEGEGLE